MTFDQMILDELKNVNLNGVTVLSVVSEPDVIRIVFEIPPAKVEFMVDADDQFQILSVNYNGVGYNEPHYLAQFEGFVLDVITKVKLIGVKKHMGNKALKQQDENSILIQGRLEALILREEQIKQQEQQLDLKEQEIKKHEKLLCDKESAIALQRQEEELKLEAKRLKNRENLQNTFKNNANGLIQKFKKKKTKINL